MDTRKGIALLLVIGLAIGWSIFFTGFLGTKAEVNPPAKIDSCAANGETQYFFATGQTVWLRGEGFNASTTYDVYVVVYGSCPIGELLPPSRVPGTTNQVTTDASGEFLVYVWHTAQHGTYDIIIDIEGDGVHTVADPMVVSTVGTAGIFVTPEYEYGALLAVAACFAAFAIIERKNIHIPKH